MSWGSKEWANDQLRYAISVLQGRSMGSRPKGRIEIALLIKDRLKKEGFWWQAKTLEYHLHRFQGQLGARDYRRKAVVGLRRIRR